MTKTRVDDGTREGQTALPGSSYPLGATWDSHGVNFALFSEHATRVELCLFDALEATAESRRIPLAEQTDMVWHAYVPDLAPGQLYRYRVVYNHTAEGNHLGPTLCGAASTTARTTASSRTIVVITWISRDVATP